MVAKDPFELLDKKVEPSQPKKIVKTISTKAASATKKPTRKKRTTVKKKRKRRSKSTTQVKK